MLEAYPSLNEAEFREACTTFEERCHDSLQGTRWVGVQWTGSSLLIKQLLPDSTDDLEQQQCSSVVAREQPYVVEDNVSDEESVLRSTMNIARRTVDFSIVLSPTYRVPVLWFTLDRFSQDLSTLYESLVPDSMRGVMQSGGIMGAISMANHPISEVPAYFIHPCNTADALLSLCDGTSLQPEQYLTLWLGLVGPGVGFYIPSQLVSDQST